jgi:hypothetical protein
VTFSTGGSLFSQKVVDMTLLYLALRKSSLRSLGDVRRIHESILNDLAGHAEVPSLSVALKTARNLGLVGDNNRYTTEVVTFAKAMILEDAQFGTRLRHLQDEVKSWQVIGPLLFRLLEKEMRDGENYAMPEQLHDLTLAFAVNSPDILARLLVESSLQVWNRTKQIMDWVGQENINPNTATLELGLQWIVDRPIEARP